MAEYPDRDRKEGIGAHSHEADLFSGIDHASNQTAGDHVRAALE